MATHDNDILDRKAAAASTIRALADRFGRPPTQNEFKAHAKAISATCPTISQALYLFGTWTNAVLAADLSPRDNRPPRSNDLTDEELVAEFVTIANRLGKLPTQAEFTQHSQYSIRPYTYRWQNWSGVKQYFLDHHRGSLDFRPNEETPTSRSRTAGDRAALSFDCSMCFVPQNEVETIVLFGQMAARMGYRIRAIRADFPDGELERDGKLVLAEFEYESGNYLQHGHSLDFEGVCICWRRTRDLGTVEVIALEDILRNWRDNHALERTGRAERSL